MTSFKELGLTKLVQLALADEGHETPTPIQADAIPALLEGHDLLGLAQTGSGKTAAFTLPMLHYLVENPAKREPMSPRALILTPTRELAGQVRDRVAAYSTYTGLRTALVIGGVPIHKQKTFLRKGADILIATPGRLEDLYKQKGVSLDRVRYFALDEVDQMLDMGFIHAIKSISSKLPNDRQSLFFSATMPKQIESLAQALLNSPVRIEMKAENPPQIEQSMMFLTKEQKVSALINTVGQDDLKSGLVFSRTKHGADRIVRHLEQAGFEAMAIHGNRTQRQRERALKAFKMGSIPLLVATDIAARGIDVQGVSHVINFDLPDAPETYVHRIGRTGRAGATGTAISLCSPEEYGEMRAIERLTGKNFGAPAGASDKKKPARKKPKKRTRPARAKTKSRPQVQA